MNAVLYKFGRPRWAEDRPLTRPGPTREKGRLHGVISQKSPTWEINFIPKSDCTLIKCAWLLHKHAHSLMLLHLKVHYRSTKFKFQAQFNPWHCVTTSSLFLFFQVSGMLDTCSQKVLTPRHLGDSGVEMNVWAWFVWVRIQYSGGTFVNAVMNLWLQQNAENFLNSWGTVSFSGRTAPYSVS
jgi:hypothetical protein